MLGFRLTTQTTCKNKLTEYELEKSPDYTSIEAEMKASPVTKLVDVEFSHRDVENFFLLLS